MPPSLPTIPPGLNTFGQVAGNYQAAAAVASAALTPYAQHLLMMLFAIELIYTACLWALSARSGYEILEQLCRRGLAIGLMYWFLTNAVSLMTTVFNSFQQLGAEAVGVSNLSPSGVLNIGLQMAGAIMAGFAHLSFFTGVIKGGAGLGTAIILPLISSLIIVIAFTIAAAWYLVTTIEMYMVMGGGSVLIALGGSPFTAALFQRFLSKVIALGIRLMFIILTLGVGMQLANGWLAAIQSAPVLTSAMFFYLIANAIMFLITVLGVPYMASALAGDSVSFGLAQAFEATWLTGTIANGVKMGLQTAKHMATLNAGRARVAKATEAQRAAQQMPSGPQPNYPPPGYGPSSSGPGLPPPPNRGSGGGGAQLGYEPGRPGQRTKDIAIDISGLQNGNGNGNKSA